MSITPVPISMRFVLAPTAARSGKGEGGRELLGKVVDTKVSPVRTEFLCRHGQLNRLLQHIARGPRG
jgi:hypothetical protein